MTIVYLSPESLAYMSQLGTTQESVALNRAKAAIFGAMKFGADASVADAKFFLDYMDDDWEQGAEDVDLWGEVTRAGEVFKVNAAPFTDALALIISSTVFRNSNGEARNGDLFDALEKNAGLNAPPPALAITTLGNSSDNITAWDVGDDLNRDRNDTDAMRALGFVSPPSRNLGLNQDRAQGYVQEWIKYALVNNQSIDSGLLDAYISLDPAEAKTRIAEYLQAGMSGSGVVRGAFNDTGLTEGTPTNITVDPPYLQKDLLAAYRRLAGATPSSADPTSQVDFSTDFHDPAPVANGWEYFAAWSLQEQAEKGLPLDVDLLNDLDTTNPDVSNYMRWQSLMRQAETGTLDASLLATMQLNRPDVALKACIAACEALIDGGRNLNETYLNYIASQDPGAAEELCRNALTAALQPVNRLVQPAGSLGSLDHITGDTTPTIRVSLGGMGATRPVAGDIVKLSTAGGSLATSPPVVQLTDADIVRGYVDVGTTLPLGTTEVSSSFTHTGTTPPSAAFTTAGTPAIIELANTVGRTPAVGDTLTVYLDGAPISVTLDQGHVESGVVVLTTNAGTITTRLTYTTASPLSVPLPVTVLNDTTAPTWTGSNRRFTSSDGTTLDETVSFILTEGVDGTFNPHSFTLSAPGLTVTADSVVVDAANSRLILHFKHDASTPLPATGVTISYTAAVAGETPSVLTDKAGNVLPDTLNKPVATDPATYITNWVDPAPSFLPPALAAPRSPDPVALKVLANIHSSLATQFQQQFTNSGYGPAAGSSGVGGTGTGGIPDPAESIPEALQGAIARVSAIDIQIKNYFDEVKRKTDLLNKINQILATANTGMGQLPLTTTPTDKLFDHLSDTQKQLLTTNFNSMSLDLKLGFTITAETSKSDLEGYIQKLKSSSDALNNTNQLDLISVQNLSNQKQVMMQLVSTLMNSAFEAQMKIISKM